jgi:hypothetical protein
VLFGAWLVLMVYAFPGEMTADSFEHLGEARTGIYTDGHPPVMDAVFWLFEQIASMPLALLVVQTLGFLFAIHAVMRRDLAPPRAAIATAVLYLFPPILVTMAVVWKDSVMAAALLLGFAGLVDGRRWGIAALLVASAVRYNAFAATFPLVFLLFEWRPGLHWLKRYAIAGAVWLAITAVTFGVNSALVDQPMYYWHSSLAVHDIVGTLSHVDGTLPDSDLEELLVGTDLVVHHDIHAKIRASYTPRNFFPVVAGDHPLWHLPFFGTTPAPPQQRDAIARAWQTTVTRYPGAYLRHRLAVMGEVLALESATASWPVPYRGFEYPQTVLDRGMSVRASAVQYAMTDALDWLNHRTPIYKAWIYLALALVLLPFARRHRDVIALLASGILLEASLVPLAPTPDYRYSHWLVTATCVGAVIVVARRLRQT